MDTPEAFMALWVVFFWWVKKILNARYISLCLTILTCRQNVILYTLMHRSNSIVW